MLYEANMSNSKAKSDACFKATDLRYRINIVSGREGVYILSGVKEKRQGWMLQLLVAGIVRCKMSSQVHRKMGRWGRLRRPLNMTGAIK